MAAAFRDRLLDHCHIVNIRGNSYRLRDRGDLAEALRQAPLEKEPRTRTDRRRGGATVKQNSRRARIPGRSLRDSPARPSRQNRSEKPASNPRSVNFSDPISVQCSKAIDSTQSPRKCETFSKPIDIGVHAETGTVPALGFFTPRPYGPLCRPPPGELAGGRRSLAGGAISFDWHSGGDAFSQRLAGSRRFRACAPPSPAGYVPRRASSRNWANRGLAALRAAVPTWRSAFPCQRAITGPRDPAYKGRTPGPDGPGVSRVRFSESDYLVRIPN